MTPEEIGKNRGSVTLAELGDSGWPSECLDFQVGWLHETYGADAILRYEFERESWDEGNSASLKIVRPETDEEVVARLVRQREESERYRRQSALEQELHERAQFERLKAKFGA